MLSQTQFQGDYSVGKGILLMTKNLEPRGQPLELRREEVVVVGEAGGGILSSRSFPMTISFLQHSSSFYRVLGLTQSPKFL